MNLIKKTATVLVSSLLLAAGSVSAADATVDICPNNASKIGIQGV